ncbi:MAG: hypothetical protein GWM90_00125, partial [Gemmatimonadetes bacterium]|nr:hypothetical protein [Gemmatimonadota bacterium]NIQ51926.1 hypothetical protein [Gemmatimonadota bacterium]NIU72033.1 hypothetical protein [Gammaproteobacteria bacterium]NIX42595.1 hypothetical protein [Gemmatimonadota bacterium]NIY06770.1 hypothetical protein [Gemmatimonadota bacterium]
MRRRPEAPVDSRDHPPRPGEAASRGREDAGIGAALTSATRRVLADRSAWQPHALDRDEVEKALHHLCDVLQEPEPDTLRRASPAAALELQRRLLGLLRRELLRESDLAD